MDSRRPRTEGSPRTGRRRLALWKKILFSLTAVALVLAGIELALRTGGVRPLGLEEDPYVGFSGRLPLFVEEKAPGGSAILVTSPARLRFFNPQSFPARKPPGTYRIFALGGSTTYGRPYDDATSFSGWLREFLPRADPSRRWEVVNAGGISYASYRAALVMEELLRYEPDLFLVYSGHNEFLERRSYAALLETPLFLRSLGSFLSRTRTYAALHRLLVGERPAGPRDASGLLPAEVDALLDRSVGPEDYHRDDPYRERVLEHFRFNLYRLAALARSAGARVLFVVPASNLRDSSPFKSEHLQGLAREEVEQVEKLEEEARAALEAGRLEEALERVDRALGIDGRHAGLHYLRGRVLERLGSLKEARAAYERARDEDVCPLRALAAQEEIVREVAAREGAALVDFAALVASRSPGGIPGGELFLDHVHPTVEGNRRLALAILDALARLGVVRPDPGWGDEAIARVAERVEGRLDHRARGEALKNLAKVLGWAGKFEEALELGLRAAVEIPGDAEVHFNLGVCFERREDLEEALRRYRRATELEPDYPEAHKNLGRVREKQGELAAARRHYEEALRFRPGYAEARAALGNVLAREGDLPAAARALEEAVRLEPRNGEVRHKLGTVYLRLGNPQDAARHLEEAVRLLSRDARARNNLGTALAEKGESAAAEREYREALRIDPEYAKAHEHLGSLCANEGRIEEAAEHFTRALELEPGNAAARGKLEVMRERFAAVLRRRPGEPEARFYLGLVLAAAGRTGEALAELERALASARHAERGELESRIRRRLEALREERRGGAAAGRR